MVPNSESRQAPKYVAVVTGLKEVTLVGSADLPFWRRHLDPQGLHPYDKDGRAEIIISATGSRWMGVKFKEFTIAVSVSASRDNLAPDGLYLLQAFNSSRLFTFIERAFFQTPYVPAHIQVDAGPPASIGVGGTLSAGMAAVRSPMAAEEDSWEGPIHLPAGSKSGGRLFYARLAGFTERFPFDAEQDRLSINPSPGYDVFETLRSSNFSGEEWRLRLDAVHARSRTYKR